MKVPSKSTILIGLSALLAGCVFAFGFPWFVLPAALAMFFWILVGQETKSFKHSLWFTGLFFWLYYALVLGWFLDTDISLLAGLDSKTGPFVLWFCLVVMSSVLTLASLPFGAVTFYFRSRLKRPDIVALVTLIFSWALVEWLRSLVFSVFLYAPESSVGDYWNFGSLGLGIVSTPLGYFSRIVGMYGLSMLVVAIGITLFWASKKHYKPLVLVVLLAVAGSVTGFNMVPKETLQPIEARLLQGDSQFGGQTTAVAIRNKSQNKKDLIVLPEYSRLYDTENKNFTTEYVTSQLSNRGVVLDVSANFTNAGSRKSFLLTRDKNTIVDSQTKRLLIPTGEYLPSIVTEFYRLTGQSEISDKFAQTRKLEKGESPHVITTKSLTIAPVACSGILGRNIYRRLVNDGGNVLTNSASLATFAGSDSYFRQSVQMAHFHAVANNRTFIQATIGAPAFVIDGNGSYILEPDGSATEFADFSFTPKNHTTFYTKYGDWPLMLSVVYMAGFAGTVILKRCKLSSK